MLLTLKGDREFEYDFVYRNLPTSNSELLLDLGPGRNAGMSKFAIEQGYAVVGIDLEPVDFKHPKFTFVQQDFLTLPLTQQFDWILNVSTIEHFGLAGRYGVTKDNLDADLLGMAKLRDIMKPDAIMLLTVPIGQDMVDNPYHRIYGRERLSQLLIGFHIVDKEFQAKVDTNEYAPVDEDTALDTVPTRDPNYYALGAFILEVE